MISSIRYLRIKLSEPWLTHSKKVEILLNIDIFKYLLQCVYVYWSSKLIENREGLHIDMDVINFLYDQWKNINNCHELRSLLNFNEGVTEVWENGSKEARIDMEKIMENTEYNMHINYSLRLSKYISIENSTSYDYNVFLDNVWKKFSKHSELFKLVFNVSLENFLTIVKYLMSEIILKVKSNVSKYEVMKWGLINMNTYEGFFITADSFTLKNSDIKKSLKDNLFKDFLLILDNLSFIKKDFKISNLNYNLLNLTPILKISDDEFILMPDLLLDSMNFNIHYSLLQSSITENKYKTQYWEAFVDDIILLVKNFWYCLFDREVELYDWKKQLWDLDVIFYNKELNDFLIIEAKNHSLPLDVYFNSFDATKERLDYLNDKWEDKVNRRKSYLAENHDHFKISKNYKYIIVSNMPEVLSHCSKNLVLTLSELKYWLWLNDRGIDFTTLLNMIKSDDEEDLDLKYFNKHYDWVRYE